MTAVVAELTGDLRLQYGLLALSLAIGLATAVIISRSMLGQLGAEPEIVASLARDVAEGRFDRVRTTCSLQERCRGVMAAMDDMAGKLQPSFGEIAAQKAAAEAKTVEAEHSRQEAEQATARAEQARLEGLAEAGRELTRLEGSAAELVALIEALRRESGNALPS
jgi:methyl-accepting chemotaxis protein